MRTRFIIIGILLVCLLVGAVSAAEQITNGGFETGDFTGWTSLGGGSVSSVGDYVHSGTYGALLSTADKSINQSIDFTYVDNVVFWHRYGNVNVSIDGTVIFSHTPFENDWVELTVPVAYTGIHELKFITVAGGTFDDISAVSSPPPTTTPTTEPTTTATTPPTTSPTATPTPVPAIDVCENQTGNITINNSYHSTSSLGWIWGDPTNITKISEDGLYVLAFDNSSNSFIGSGYPPETWHNLKIYNQTDFGQLNCTTDAIPFVPTPIPMMPSTEISAIPVNLFSYWPVGAVALFLLVAFKK